LLIPYLLNNSTIYTNHLFISNTKNNSVQTAALSLTNKAMHTVISNNHIVQLNNNDVLLQKQPYKNLIIANVNTARPVQLNSIIDNKSLTAGCLYKLVNDSLSLNIKPHEQGIKPVITVAANKKNKFSLMPFISFDHTSGRLIEQYEFNNESAKDYAQREKPDMSFTAGLLADYTLNKRFSLRSGLSVSSAALTISSTAVNALKDNSGVYKFKLGTSYGLAEISKSGFMPSAGDSLVVKDASLKFKYLSLPVLLNYTLSNKKIKFSVHGGIAINKIISDKVEVDYTAQNNNNEIETINKIEGLKKTFFTINTGFEAGYPITSKVDISLSPELRYGINSINKGTPVKTYPINYGIALNVHIKL